MQQKNGKGKFPFDYFSGISQHSRKSRKLIFASVSKYVSK